MATYYCVANAGWAAASFASTSGGAAGAGTPGSADDVIYDGLSPSFNLTGAATARSIDFNSGGAGGAYANTFTYGAGASITLTGATANPSGFILRLSAGMTWTNTGTTAITITSTSSLTQQLVSAGKTLPPITLNGVAASSPHIQLGDALTVNGIFTHFAGVVDLNGQNFTTSGYNASASWGQLILGTGNTITIGTGGLGATGGRVISGTNNTINAQSSVQLGATTMTDLTGTAITVTGAGTPVVACGVPIASLTRTGTAVVSDALLFNGALTITGTLTLTGNSTKNRLLVQSNFLGTSRTITAGAVALTNVDFQDITGAGAAAPWSSASLLGDCQGNSGITFPASTTQTWTPAGGGTWSTVASWTSRIPLPHDDVVCNPFSGAMTLDMPRLGRNVVLTTDGACSVSTALSPQIFGDATFTQQMQAIYTFTLQARSAATLTAGSIPSLIPSINTPGGSYTLQGDASFRQVNLIMGTFNDGGHTLSLPSGTPAITTSGVSARTLALSGVTNLGGGGTPWNLASVTGLTFQHTGTLAFSGASNGSTIFAAGGLTYNNVTFPALPDNSVQITGGATINGTLTLQPGTWCAITANTTVTVGRLNALGANWGYQYKSGTFGNSVMTPNSAALQITGSMTLDVRAAPNNYNANTTLLSKWGSSQFGYRLSLGLGGKLVLWLSTNGTTASSFTSTAALPTQAGAQWFRASWTAGATGKVQFYYSADGVTWTQLGTDVAATLTATFLSTAQVEIGSDTGGTISSITTGPLYRARIYSGALGAGQGSNPVYDVDFSLKPFMANSFTESSANALTVNMIGVAEVVGDGRTGVACITTAGAKANLVSTPDVGGNSLRNMNVQDIAAAGNATWWADPAMVLTRTTGFTQAVPARTKTVTHSQSPAESGVQGQTFTASAIQAQHVSYQTGHGLTATFIVTQAQQSINKPPPRTLTAGQAQALSVRSNIPVTLSAIQDQALSRLPDTLTTTRTLTQSQAHSLRRDLVCTHTLTQGQPLRVVRRITTTFELTGDQSVSYSAAIIARRLAQGQLGALVTADISTTLTVTQDQHVRRLRGAKRAHFTAGVQPRLWTSSADEPVVLAGRQGNQVIFTTEQG